MGICYLTAFVTTGKMFQDNASFYLICLTLGNSLGQFIVPLLFETFIANYSWSGAFILIAGVSLQCVPCGVLIHYSKTYFTKLNTRSSAASSAICDKTLLTDGIIWIVLINFFLNSLTGMLQIEFN